MYIPQWMDDLQPATWRGFTFYVDSIKHSTGRRVAVHEYPFRDKPWVEDLGLGLQEFTFQGFILGDDVADQLKRLKAEVEKKGSGDLVHPRLGMHTVSLVNAAFVEKKEEGNVVGVNLTFLVTQTESSLTLWPVASGLASGGLAGAALNVSGAANGDFLSRVGSAIKEGTAAVKSVVETTQGYVRQVQNVVGDATRAVNVVSGIGAQLGIKVNVGRFLAPLNAVSRGITTVNTGIAMVTRVNSATSSLLSGASRARASVDAAATRVTDLVKKL